jgi:hypothetical protein
LLILTTVSLSLVVSMSEISEQIIFHQVSCKREKTLYNKVVLEILTEAVMKNTVFFDIMLYSPLNVMGHAVA